MMQRILRRFLAAAMLLAVLCAPFLPARGALAEGSVPMGTDETFLAQCAKRTETASKFKKRKEQLTEELRSYYARYNELSDNVRFIRIPASTPQDVSAEALNDAHTFESAETMELAHWENLAIFAIARYVDKVSDPSDVFGLSAVTNANLREAFWDMIDIRTLVNGKELIVMMGERTLAEIERDCGLTNRQRRTMLTLMQPEYQRILYAILGEESYYALTAEEEARIRARLPETLDERRKRVVLYAYSLVDKVDYFWGGKYNERLGYSENWGLPATVVTEGSSTTGERHPYGLDCSGYITWVFINAFGDVKRATDIGNGSAAQWLHARPIEMEDLQPGDLVFRNAPEENIINHVGIVVDRAEDGAVRVAHCSPKVNTVAVVDVGQTDLVYARRPMIYEQ